MAKDLSLEQEFNTIVFEQQIQSLNKDQLVEMAIALFRQNTAQRVLYEQLIGHQWGFLDNPAGGNDVQGTP